ncbi:hypothetical protein AX14_004837, partial [Amanita brunnescens Koide BX004]
MISFVSKLLLAALVFNTASVIAAPVRRAVVPRAPEPTAPEPIGSLAPRIVDFPGPGHSTISRRTMSRRQARLVEREPIVEQPPLESRDTPVAVEQRSDAHQRRRYPRRVYFEHYEKRSPDSLDIPSTSHVKIARDGGHHHNGCDCNSGLNMRSFVSVARLFTRCKCDGQPSAMSSMQQPGNMMGSMNGNSMSCSNGSCGGSMSSMMPPTPPPTPPCDNSMSNSGMTPPMPPMSMSGMMPPMSDCMNGGMMQNGMNGGNGGMMMPP